MTARRATGAFRDRREAGAILAAQMTPLAQMHPIVLALPRGGVPVAYEVAHALGAPLDLLLVRKVGAPGNPELGIGAVAEGGVRVLDPELIQALMVSPEELERSLSRAGSELVERGERYRGGSPPTVAGRTVILVDDGVATGGTAMAAVQALRARDASRIVVAVPVAAAESAARLRAVADEVMCVEEPLQLGAVGSWFEDFSAVTDAEVTGLLRRSRAEHEALGDDRAP